MHKICFFAIFLIVSSLAFAFDVAIDKQLEEEGGVREFIRQIQDNRKRLGFHPKESFLLSLESGNADIRLILKRWRRTIECETHTRIDWGSGRQGRGAKKISLTFLGNSIRGEFSFL